MSTLAIKHGATNLGQGFPNFDGKNQYARGHGIPELNSAIAARFLEDSGLVVQNVPVCSQSNHHGPWEDMRKFDDKIPKREFDNFQFVNFTEIMKRDSPETAKETAFALAALMEIPFQYQATVELRLLGKQTGLAKKINPRPPPIPYTPPISTGLPSQEQTQNCPICLTNQKDEAFNCGHTTCKDCGSRISNCPICRVLITNRLRLYT